MLNIKYYRMFPLQVELSMTGNLAFKGTDKKRFMYRSNMTDDLTHCVIKVIDEYKQKNSEQYFGFLKVCKTPQPIKNPPPSVAN